MMALSPWLAALALALPQEGRAEFRASADADRSEYYFALKGRTSVATGDMDEDLELRYQDIFHTGEGFGLEGAYLVPLDPFLRVGGYLSAAWDRFEGKSATDEVGDILEPDEWEFFTLMAGVKGHWLLGGSFQADGRVGVGAVRMSDVDAVHTVGGVPSDIDLFKSSWAGTFEGGFRFGYAFGPLALELGGFLCVLREPDQVDVDYSLQSVDMFGLELALTLRF